jgi:hypothetical protein
MLKISNSFLRNSVLEFCTKCSEAILILVRVNLMQLLWDIRFSRRWRWRCCCSELWGGVDLQVGTDVSEVVLGDVMVTVLLIGAKVRGFKPGWGVGFLRAIKIRNTTSFGGEVKLSAPFRNILRHVTGPFEVWTKILRKAKLIIYLASSSCFATKWLYW